MRKLQMEGCVTLAEYLEREELLRQLRLWHMHRNDEMPDHFHYTGIKAWLEAMPAEDVQPVKHGRWLTEYEPDGKPYCFHCSVCDSDFSIIRNKIAYDYCPDCGAKMDGET